MSIHQEKYLSRLRALQKISTLLNSSLDPTETREKAIAAATVLMEADVGSLLLLDKANEHLYFDVALGEKGEQVRKIHLALGEGIAGYVAKTGESVIVNDVQNDPRFSTKSDTQAHFLTRNMVCVPILAKDKLLGVLQAVNKKNGDDFDEDDLQIFIGLANQVGIAIENANLYTEINGLFEGFIRAGVAAIESRDPSTSGHSERVAVLTCNLTRAVDMNQHGPYAKTFFSTSQIKEIRYAAMLHDIGKIGVHEHLLVKAEKLFPLESALIAARFDYILRTLELEASHKKMAILIKGGAASELSKIDEKFKRKREETEAILASIWQCNRPTVLPQGEFESLQKIATMQYDYFGQMMPYLTSNEVSRLSISKGSLTNSERLAIQSHVQYTSQILLKIPWTESLKNVPTIARAHHEKLDGSGYPDQILEDAIPIQAKMMTICDIYDALTASDRPYKVAVPIPKALAILEDEAGQGKIDRDLLGIFLDSKAYLPG
ncbi:MAG: HD domain-containing phosphohydrolase [Nitrospirota bacterium]